MNSDICSSPDCGPCEPARGFVSVIRLAIDITDSPLSFSLTSPAVEDTGPERAPRCLPTIDAEELEYWERFLESSTSLVDMLNRILTQRHQLNLFDVMLLQLLGKSTDGSARMGDLAVALALTPSRLTQQTSRLVARGLVHRKAGKRDRRNVIATITDNGRMHLKDALKTYARVVRSHYLGPLSRQQMSALGDSSRRIGSALKNSDPSAKPGRQ